MLKLCNITKSFDGFKALDNLSMTVPKGAVYGLVGPNGAGKSTAIRIVTGVYRPDSGTVSVEGAPVWENDAVKARMGYIPDEIFYFPSATLDELQSYYKSFYKNFDTDLYRRLFDIFQLPQKGQLRRFSKGMQKQAAFLLSLCCRPELLILDEPVDGLDPVMRRQVWSLILSEVAQRETTVVISSHNLRELEDVCDHVGIMDHGKMLLERSLADMQGATHKLQLVGNIPAQLEVLHTTDSGRLKTLVVRGNAQDIAELVQKENPVYFDVLPLSLEEIFIYELGGVNYEVKNIVL